MRLIDADAYIEEALSRIDPQDMYLPIHIKEIVLDKMPTIDAVTVVRCKDCKYWYQDFEGKCIASTPYGTDTDPDEFCSRAERNNIS